jgi:hypothetical protein
MIRPEDRDTMRVLAQQWMDLAADPVMAERKRLWTAVHDLKADRPVILIEAGWIEGFVADSELKCENPILRAVEKNMRITIRQGQELGDDIVIEPFYRMGWRMKFSDYGVPIEIHGTKQASMGYGFNYPIGVPDDIKKLKKRTISVDREKTALIKDTLEDAIGDILPVKVGNFDPFVYEFDCGEFGDLGFNGNFFFGLTWQLYRFLGNDSLPYWVYDHPDAIHEIMQYLLEDRIAMFKHFEDKKLLALNTDTQMAGPRSYGYASDLPDAESSNGDVSLKNMWGWAESQESTIISPDMYKEFVLPYLAKLGSMFGLVYYGCCESLDDRLEMIVDAMPNLRSVSISGWSDLEKTAEILGSDYVYSRKPTPAHLSGANPNWDLAEKDMKDTYQAAGKGNVEILLRDLYDINGDIPRLRKWVDMTKSIFGI